jgi:hypothetical protein
MRRREVWEKGLGERRSDTEMASDILVKVSHLTLLSRFLFKLSHLALLVRRIGPGDNGQPFCSLMRAPTGVGKGAGRRLAPVPPSTGGTIVSVCVSKWRFEISIFHIWNLLHVVNFNQNRMAEANKKREAGRPGDDGCRHMCRLHALFVSVAVSHVKVGLIRLVVR